MNSIKEISPCFDKVTSVTDSKEFIQNFCLKALKLLEEFKSTYSDAITAKKISELDAITHKISSTMAWLDLGEFVALIKSYKDFSVFDKNTSETLLAEVMHNTNMIEGLIRKKIADL